MKQAGKILIVDDDADILIAGKLLLKRHFSHISTCNQPENILTFLNEQSFDAILLDMNFGPGESSGNQGFYWLQKILKKKPDSVVIMITAHGGVDIAVDAMKQGATDFISKPWENEKVIATLSTAVKLGRTRTEALNLKQQNQALVTVSNQTNQFDMIGNSLEMQHVQSLITRCAPTDANVIILGENGTGKELVAREIHAKSYRANNVFMSVDLGSISETLFESELFGYKKGAFTGAQESRVGRFKAADGGTLFLDEIGNLPLHLQAKLLTVLEQREVTPIGTNTPIPFDVRVVSATNVAKSNLINESHFRQDLLFRLNTVEIHLPALRERSNDIALIAEHFLAIYRKKYSKQKLSLSKEAVESLKQSSWPGNVRALRHAMERAVILCDVDVLTPSDFQLEKSFKSSSESSVSSPSNTDQEFNLDALEKQTITQALKNHQYNISQSAKVLGLTRAALYRRMEKYGL